VIQLLESLIRPLSSHDSLADLSQAILELVLRCLPFDFAVIGEFDRAGRFSPLGMRDHRPATPGASSVQIPAQWLYEVRVRGKAFFVCDPPLGLGSMAVLLPSGTAGAGALFLAAPREGTRLDDRLLRVGTVLAQIAWVRIDEVKEREALQGAQQREAQSRSRAWLEASPRLRRASQALREAAKYSLHVKLVGEDGTEKEELARFLHAESDRAARPFIPCDVHAVPPERIERELFGDGGDAAAASEGGWLLGRAHGGTLYIDAPELMPERVQDRLGHALATGHLSLGSRGRVPVDVRLVAASSEPRQEATLRPALREVLGGMAIVIPPLRRHPADIALLTDLLLASLPATGDGAPRSITQQAREVLAAFDWPGNVRQLRLVLETAATLAGRSPIAPRHLPEQVRDQPKAMRTLAAVEREHIQRVLDQVGGVKARAAAELGIATSTLYAKIRRLGIR
jgi:two-component system response regulator HydG